MSMQVFAAMDRSLEKTEYFYKRILPDIADGDMFFNDKIIFDDKLTEQQAATIGDIFKGYKVYAVDSCFNFSYNPTYKRQLSERYAINALDELKWFKQFAKKKLQNGGVFMAVNLWLGREYPFKRVKTEQIDVDGWQLAEDVAFEFSYGTVYKFSVTR
ncbi:MAG: hypothetical protein LUD27_01075 [Clostridia bacterium]|nr:hypothetical protein [Clostridia bacterium]